MFVLYMYVWCDVFFWGCLLVRWRPVGVCHPYWCTIHKKDTKHEHRHAPTRFPQGELGVVVIHKIVVRRRGQLRFQAQLVWMCVCMHVCVISWLVKYQSPAFGSATDTLYILSTTTNQKTSNLPPVPSAPRGHRPGSMRPARPRTPCPGGRRAQGCSTCRFLVCVGCLCMCVCILVSGWGVNQ